MKEEKGQGLVEYAIILVIVAVVVIAIIWAFYALIIAMLWPWLVSTAFPFFVETIDGVKTGDSRSIAILAVLIVVTLFILIRRR